MVYSRAQDIQAGISRNGRDNMPVQATFLNSASYFLGLGTADLESVRGRIFEKAVKRGEIILLEGETSDVLYFVVSGAVKEFKTSPEGKEQILTILRPGDSFNDIAVFDEGPSGMSVEALGPVVVYGIGRRDLMAILQEYPQAALNATRALAGRARHLVSLVEDLSFKQVIARVAKILLEYVGDGAASGTRLSQQQMAAMAGTVREVVGRSLKSLEESEAIRLDRHRIVIVDKEALKNLAQVS